MRLFKNNPCKACEKRHPGCHSDCEDGIAWKKQYEEAKRKIELERDRYLATGEVLSQGRKRRQRKIHIKEKQR